MKITLEIIGLRHSLFFLLITSFSTTEAYSQKNEISTFFGINLSQTFFDEDLNILRSGSPLFTKAQGTMPIISNSISLSYERTIKNNFKLGVSARRMKFGQMSQESSHFGSDYFYHSFIQTNEYGISISKNILSSIDFFEIRIINSIQINLFHYFSDGFFFIQESSGLVAPQGIQSFLFDTRSVNTSKNLTLFRLKNNLYRIGYSFGIEIERRFLLDPLKINVILNCNAYSSLIGNTNTNPPDGFILNPNLLIGLSYEM